MGSQSKFYNFYDCVVLEFILLPHKLTVLNILFVLIYFILFYFKIQESLPPEYARIFAFDNFTRTQKLVLAKAQEMEQSTTMDECIPASSYVRLHIKEVPFGVASKLYEFSKVGPVIACGLLQHESKISVLHFRYLFLASLFLLSWT